MTYFADRTGVTVSDLARMGADGRAEWLRTRLDQIEADRVALRAELDKFIDRTFLQ